jgi:hypothetical protein
MGQETFRDYLVGRQLPPDVVNHHLALAARFSDYLESARSQSVSIPPDRQDVTAFVKLLARDGLDTYDNLVALARYGWFTDDRPTYLGALELLDGSEVMENLHTRLGQAVGDAVRDRVFEGIPLPPIGTPNTAKPAITQAVMDRLAHLVEPEVICDILSQGLRNLPAQPYLAARDRYAASESLDEFLDREEQVFLTQLEDIKNRNGLFFDQEITDEALDFVRSHPEISRGVRVGRVLYEVKIPYRTHEYLAATDERQRRYLYCHCPWARESLRTDDISVSPTFCLCSSGYHKRRWEVILDRSLQAEVVQSVLAGDPWCKIAIHLPADIPLDG